MLTPLTMLRNRAPVYAVRADGLETRPYGVPRGGRSSRVPLLNLFERAVGLRRQLDAYPVAGSHLAARDHDAHDAGFPHEVALFVAIEDGRHEAVLEAVELPAGVAQARHPDERLLAEAERGPGRQAEQVDAAGGYVLAHLPGPDVEARRPQLVVELRVYQVDLPEVRSRRVPSHPGAVLHRLAHVGVALDAEPRQEPDAVFGRLAEGVPRAAAYRDHLSVEDLALLSWKGPLAPSIPNPAVLADRQTHDPQNHAQGGEEAAFEAALRQEAAAQDRPDEDADLARRGHAAHRGEDEGREDQQVR